MPLKASQEWVVPPREKSGRKPSTHSAQEGSSDSSRKIQNRASQRAFRERKQEYLASLEAKIKQLEHGEGEKSVYFQGIAKKLKDENDKLKDENNSLKRKLQELETSVTETQEENKKRRQTLEDEEVNKVIDDFGNFSPLSLPALPDPQTIPSLPIPPPMIYTSPSNIPPAHLPEKLERSEYGESSPSHSQNLSDIHYDSETCGFCSDNNECLCSQILVDDISKVEIEFAKPAVSSSEKRQEGDIKLDIDAVPLRKSSRRAENEETRSTAMAASVLWDLITPNKTSGAGESSVSRNRSDSLDDSFSKDRFGQAFSSTLSNIICNSSNPCPDCPNNPLNRARVANIRLPSLKDAVGEEGMNATDGLSTSEAWKTFRDHPNIGFKNLKLLAEVVSRHTYCEGPKISTSPPSALPAILPSPTDTTAESVDSASREERPPRATPIKKDRKGKGKLRISELAVKEAFEYLDSDQD